MTDRTPSGVRQAISESGLTIYDDLSSRPELILAIAEVEALVRTHATGANINAPIRTRSKLAKQAVAHALGYPVPASFKRTKPRFPGQNLDVHVQSANNLQIWNTEVEPDQRYVIIRPDKDENIGPVRVLTGDVVAAFDRTGTLTSKFQAKRRAGQTGSKLVSGTDTASLAPWLGTDPATASAQPGYTTASPPKTGSVLPIADVYARLSTIVGTSVTDPGVLQDRLRGEALQATVASSLDAGEYGNFGQWPDIRNQAIEVKLQMSPTVDLGLVLPSSAIEAEYLGGGLQHRDVRYAVFYGEQAGPTEVAITSLVLTTGEDFFNEFQQFRGLTKNQKLQIPLPRNLFESE